jgi:hypothetical protein
MKKMEFFKTINFTNDDLKKIRRLLKVDDEISNLETWNLDDLNDLVDIRGRFMAIVLNRLIIKNKDA